MQIKIAALWERLRTSYWFLPSVMSIVAAALALLAVRADRTVAENLPTGAWWLFGGGSDGARAILSAIVGSMISVTSVVFSITIVSLTLASGQFGPRLLRNFMRDRANQVVLGTFIGTFIYALLVLLTVQSLEERNFVPQVAISGAVVLVIASVGVLIFFIHHIATSIQADSVIAAAAAQLRESIDRLFPDPREANADTAPGFAPVHDAVEDEEEWRHVGSPRDDYVQGIDLDALVRLAREQDLTVRLHRRPGDFVLEGATMATVGLGRARDPDLDLDTAILDVFVLGPHRTLTQDAEFGFLQLVEIAVRALSPGINDPFTAISCIDRLCSALGHLSTRQPAPTDLRDEDGRLRVLVDTTSFAGYADSAFNQIRQNAGGSVAVLIRMLEGIASVAERVTDEEDRAALREHANLLREDGERTIESGRDLANLKARHAAAIRALASRTGSRPFTLGLGPHGFPDAPPGD